MNEQELKEIQEIIQAQNEKLEENLKPYSEMPKILILGTKQSGKTAIKCSLFEENDGKAVYFQIANEKNQECFNLFYQINVDTISNLVIIECHYFDENEELDKDIIKNSLLYSIIQNNSKGKNKIKILLVISSSNCDSNRGKDACKIFDALSNMFPDPEVKDGIGLIITKGDLELTGNDYIERMNDNSPQNMKEWCEFFSEKSDNVFIFPDLSKNRSANTSDFDDHERLIEFIQDNYIINPLFKFQLGESNKIKINNHKLCIYDQFDESIEQIIDELSYKIQNDNNNLDHFSKWLNDLKDIKNKSNFNIKDINIFIHENIGTNSIIDLQLNKIEEIYRYDSFLDELLKLEQPNSIIAKKINTYINKVIDHIGHLLEECNLSLESEKCNSQLVDELEYTRQIYSNYIALDSEMKKKLTMAKKHKQKKNNWGKKCIMDLDDNIDNEYELNHQNNELNPQNNELNPQKNESTKKLNCILIYFFFFIFLFLILFIVFFY